MRARAEGRDRSRTHESLSRDRESTTRTLSPCPVGGVGESCIESRAPGVFDAFHDLFPIPRAAYLTCPGRGRGKRSWKSLAHPHTPHHSPDVHRRTSLTPPCAPPPTPTRPLSAGISHAQVYAAYGAACARSPDSKVRTPTTHPPHRPPRRRSRTPSLVHNHLGQMAESCACEHIASQETRWGGERACAHTVRSSGFLSFVCFRD